MNPNPTPTVSLSRETKKLPEKSCVLVVDDDQTILEAIRLALDDVGYDVQTAINGKDALDQMPSCNPALILLDMRMPVIDGWEFVRLYRQLPPPHAPIVVLTAAENAARSAAEVGADNYLAKPFDLDELFELVERYAIPTPAEE